jgi:hypothetical protein
VVKKIIFQFLSSQTVDCQDYTEILAIKATINNSDLAIFNVYIPPVSSCPQTFHPHLSPIFNCSDEDVLVVGDFNAHHDAWDSTLADSRGGAISDSIKISPLIQFNGFDRPQ